MSNISKFKELLWNCIFRPSYRPTDPPTYKKTRPSYLPPPPPPTYSDKTSAPIYRAESRVERTQPHGTSSSHLPSPSLLKTSPSISRLTITPQDQEFQGNRIEERVFIKDAPEYEKTPIQLTPESIESAWENAPAPATPAPTSNTRKQYWNNNNRVSSKESSSGENRRISNFFKEAQSGFPSFEQQFRGRNLSKHLICWM